MLSISFREHFLLYAFSHTNLTVSLAVLQSSNTCRVPIGEPPDFVPQTIDSFAPDSRKK